MNIKDIALVLKGFSDTPELDAHFFCDGFNRSPEEIQDFIRRRRAGEPVSKIMGVRGFWKFDFKTSQDVLDPRPDSETLIETVLGYYKDISQSLDILDVGTGSGCLLATLLHEYKNARGAGVDVSQKALEVAKVNLRGLNAKLAHKDFMCNGWTHDLGCFDIIISNPPYIPTDEIETLDEAVKVYDPMLALDGGADGLNAYRALAQSLGGVLKPDGKVFFEIGQGQQSDVINIMRQNGWTFLSMHKDLGDIVRVLVFQK